MGTSSKRKDLLVVGSGGIRNWPGGIVGIRSRAGGGPLSWFLGMPPDNTLFYFIIFLEPFCFVLWGIVFHFYLRSWGIGGKVPGLNRIWGHFLRNRSLLEIAHRIIRG